MIWVRESSDQACSAKAKETHLILVDLHVHSFVKKKKIEFIIVGNCEIASTTRGGKKQVMWLMF